jgi:DNA-directed RNA polymerase
MLKSALECGKSGITFAAVHDSYWTHAGSIDSMNKILRDCFVDLHSFDLIQALRDEFKVRYDGLLQVIALPKNSSLAKEITAAREMWSLQKFGKVRKIDMFEEIEMEHERRQAIACGFPDVHETSSSIIQRTDPAVLERLQLEVASMRKKNAAKKNINFKSSYRPGCGVDRFDDLERAMDEMESKTASQRVEEHISDVTEEGEAVTDEDAVSEEDDFDATKPPSRQVMYALAPIKVSEIPPKGDLDIEEVRNSKYFFC